DVGDDGSTVTMVFWVGWIWVLAWFWFSYGWVLVGLGLAADFGRPAVLVLVRLGGSLVGVGVMRWCSGGEVLMWWRLDLASPGILFESLLVSESVEICRFLVYLVDFYRVGVDCFGGGLQAETYLPSGVFMGWVDVFSGGLKAEECPSKNGIRSVPLLGGDCFGIFIGVPLTGLCPSCAET
ncbi:hypothetical protein A2U01_0004496, partial [Trifolium medium]|nr:hypothetical protein [Trifolium medium]